MSDQKAERLLNLTLALLATKRFLTKNEIFQTIAGYTGLPESMERMFERDKDDLRSLGIEIEVGNLDQYFEDELGYRIRPNNYGLEIGEISPRELALLSIASHSWRNSVLSESSQSAVRKLRSLGVEVDQSDLTMGWARFENPQPDFDQLWEALENRRRITFFYNSTTLAERTLDPYGITLLRGFWYLVGFDNDRGEIRVFKISRIHGEIFPKGKPFAFEVPKDFQISQHLGAFIQEHPQTAQLLVKKERCHILRNDATVVNFNDEWDRLTLHYQHEDSFLRKVLWFGPDAIIESPRALRAKAMERLKGASE